MKKYIFLLISLLIILVAILFRAFSTNSNDKLNDFIRVEFPKPDDLISSPLVILGEARGGWYFEADFPVRLLDDNGGEVARGVAMAKDNWMTEDFVPFESVIVFSLPTTKNGMLILEKNNPSGLSENAAEVRIPVRFSSSQTTARQIKLFFYNESKDKDSRGNILCSTQSLESVERTIPISNTPIQDTIRFLLKGEISSTERANGLRTEFPLSGLNLIAASLSTDGVLTLTFADPENRTIGGSCRINILRSQIEMTAKQFNEVREVRLMPEELFQP